jgi:hypothetical protein
MGRWHTAAALGALVSIALATPAAAGSGGGDASRTLAATFIDLVKEAWDEDPSLVALRARDKGYSVDQMIEAIGDDALASDGTVTDEGRTVTPDGPAAGVLADEDEAEVLAAIARNERSVAKPKFVNPPKEHLEDNIFMLAVLLGLMSEGYTQEQIIVDGLFGDGIRSDGPFSPMFIVDEDGERIAPGEGPDVDPAIDGVIRDMAAIVQGEDPLDPNFKPRYDATYAGKLAILGGTVTISGKGQLGVGADGGEGDVYLGRLKGKLVVPDGDRCPGETVSIVIGLMGLEPDSGKTVKMDQTWAYAGSTGGASSGGFCITAADAPELVGPLGGVLGPLFGPVAAGSTLKTGPTTGASSATLTLTRR